METLTKVHKMSNVQERQLLKKLVKCTPIDAGSSRLVFIDPRNPNFVVKVAVGSCSFRQNKAEVELWKTWGDYGYLARIKEYGNFCVVMERMVETLDECEYGNLEPRLQEKAERVANWMSEIVGESGDNYQVGRTADGRVVSYDYGFKPYQDTAEQCGWAGHVDDNGAVRPYLRHIHSLLLRKEPTTKCELFRKQVADYGN